MAGVTTGFAALPARMRPRASACCASRMMRAITVLFSLELRLALFHEGAAAFAEILRIHAVDSDLLDCGHVAVGLVFQYLRNRDLGRLDRQRRVARDRACDLHGC